MKIEMQQSFGRKLKQARQSKGLSQVEFSERLGVEPSSVSRWETGSSFPNEDKIPAILAELGVDREYFLKVEKEKNREEMENQLRSLLAFNVASHRQKQNLSKNDLASKAGITYDDVTRIEAADRSVKSPVIRKIAAAFGISEGELSYEGDLDEDYRPAGLTGKPGVYTFQAEDADPADPRSFEQRERERSAHEMEMKVEDLEITNRALVSQIKDLESKIREKFESRVLDMDNRSILAESIASLDDADYSVLMDVINLRRGDFKAIKKLEQDKTVLKANVIKGKA